MGLRGVVTLRLPSSRTVTCFCSRLRRVLRTTMGAWIDWVRMVLKAVNANSRWWCMTENHSPSNVLAVIQHAWPEFPLNGKQLRAKLKQEDLALNPTNVQWVETPCKQYRIHGNYSALYLKIGFGTGGKDQWWISNCKPNDLHPPSPEQLSQEQDPTALKTLSSKQQKPQTFRRLCQSGLKGRTPPTKTMLKTRCLPASP